MESASKPAKEPEPELVPPPAKEEAPNSKLPAPEAKPDALTPASQPAKTPPEVKEPSMPKQGQEVRRQSLPNISPYNPWPPSLDSHANSRRP
jgi:hypothetical protein